MASQHIVTVSKESRIAVVRTVQAHGQERPNPSLFSNSQRDIIQLK